MQAIGTTGARRQQNNGKSAAGMWCWREGDLPSISPTVPAMLTKKEGKGREEANKERVVCQEARKMEGVECKEE